MKSSIFTKLLLVLLAIFMGLVYYAYGTFQKEKELIEKKKVVVTVNTPMPHPPLSNKKKIEMASTPQIDEDKNQSISNEASEYIALEVGRGENFLNDEERVIPQDEISNYPIAQTVPLEEEGTEGIDSPKEEVNPDLETFIENEEANLF